MAVPSVVKFADVCVDLRPHGASSFVKPRDSTAVTTDQGTLLWDPGTVGLRGSVGFQDTDSAHGGERHLDGDELLYLISGGMRLVLMDDGGSEELELTPGDAVLVPQGRWHRLIIAESLPFLRRRPHRDPSPDRERRRERTVERSCEAPEVRQRCLALYAILLTCPGH